MRLFWKQPLSSSQTLKTPPRSNHTKMMLTEGKKTKFGPTFQFQVLYYWNNLENVNPTIRKRPRVTRWYTDSRQRDHQECILIYAISRHLLTRYCRSYTYRRISHYRKNGCRLSVSFLISLMICDQTLFNEMLFRFLVQRLVN